jgi:hypothetical protein
MPYASFVALLVLDAVALVSLLIVQLLGAPIVVAWGAAGILITMASPALLRVADKMFAMARSDQTIPLPGESFL